MQQRNEELELDGVQHVFRGEPDSRKLAWNCWKEATGLRKTFQISKNPTSPVSEWERIVFGNFREFSNFEELFLLFPKDLSYWKIEVFFAFKRLTAKFNCFPNSFAVENLFEFALKGWEDRGCSRARAFAISNYLFEIFGKGDFLFGLVKNPTESNDVVHATFTEFCNIFHRNHFFITEQNRTVY